MEKGFRESMRWLHTWSGLIVGWLLFAIFVTGTSAYYKDEINLWMKPEFYKSKVSDNTINIAITKAIENIKKANKVDVTLPNSRSNTIAIKVEGISNNTNNNANVKKVLEEKNLRSAERNIQNSVEPALAFNKNVKNRDNNADKRNSEFYSKEKNTSSKKNNSNVETFSKVKENTSNQKNTKNAGGNRRKRVPPTYYDASSGEIIKDSTKTAGGDFLYRFHFELYSIPRELARWIVGIATMIMLVAIISGIIIHKRIFKDIFTFRPKNNPRGWLDAHVLPAVAALPFFIMITYSGLVFFSNTMMPWPVQVHYDNFRSYKQEMKGGFNTDNKNNITESSTTKKESRDKNQVFSKNNLQVKNVQRRNRNNSQTMEKNTQSSNSKKEIIKEVTKNTNLERLILLKAKRNISKSVNNKSAHRIISAHAKKTIGSHKINDVKKLELTKENLLKIIKQARAVWPDNIGGFSIQKDELKKSITVSVKAKNSNSLFNARQKESIIYDGLTSKFIKESTPSLRDSLILNTSGALRSLHEAKFADSTIRFLFFICGILGIILSGTGLILWLEKRKKKNLNTKTFGFYLVEKLNLGTIMGLFIAIAVYFIANRLLSVDESLRKEFEINAFFISWLLSYVYAFVRVTSKAWREQLLFASILFISLPIINAITVYDSFYQIFSRDNIFIYFDICMLFLSGVFTLVRFILIRKAKRGEIK